VAPFFLDHPVGVFCVDVDCQYGEDVRSIWLKEYVRWCKEFADYSTRYRKWTCMKVKVIAALNSTLYVSSESVYYRYYVTI